jgi:hypothetical protein
MKALRMRHQQTVADPRQLERLLKALTPLLEHQEDRPGSRRRGARLAQATTTRRHHRESTARAHAAHAAPRVVAAARACIER